MSRRIVPEPRTSRIRGCTPYLAGGARSHEEALLNQLGRNTAADEARAQAAMDAIMGRSRMRRL